jgi:putative GTP pyrophosphokinase
MENIRKWREFLIPYEQAVEELKVKLKAIRKEYRDLSKYSPIEFVTGRVKKISSIIEKAERREIPLDQIDELMEDIAGIRIMCQFKDDIYDVVRLIRERDGKDLEVFYEKDYISNPKESGYKSYHLVIKYPVQTAFGEKKILAEIQIRTLAMNFWATIEHSLNYKYKRNLPTHVREKLKNAAEAVNMLDEEVLDIRDEIINAQKVFEEKSNTVLDITSNIKLLELEGENKKALEFQKEFEKLWADGKNSDFEDLLRRIKKELPRYDIFNDE